MTEKSERLVRGEIWVSSREVRWEKFGTLSIQRGKWQEEEERI